MLVGDDKCSVLAVVSSTLLPSQMVLVIKQRTQAAIRMGYSKAITDLTLLVKLPPFVYSLLFMGLPPNIIRFDYD